MYKALLFLLTLSLLGCNTNKGIADSNSQCHERAFVKDFTGLDGCGLLLVLENGDKYLPAKNSVKDFTLKAGQFIQFGYKTIPDAISSCMTENKSIELTCAELIKPTKPTKPEPIQCVETSTPEEVRWMSKLIAEHNPYEIVKYNYKDGWAYHFIGGPKQWLYDCQGTFLCDVTGKIMNDCVRTINGLGKGTSIWKNSNK